MSVSYIDDLELELEVEQVFQELVVDGDLVVLHRRGGLSLTAMRITALVVLALLVPPTVAIAVGTSAFVTTAWILVGAPAIVLSTVLLGDRVVYELHHRAL